MSSFFLPPFAASLFTSTPFKTGQPTSDVNETENPYVSPTLSDEALAKLGDLRTRVNHRNEGVFAALTLTVFCRYRKRRTIACRRMEKIGCGESTMHLLLWSLAQGRFESSSFSAASRSRCCSSYLPQSGFMVYKLQAIFHDPLFIAA